MGPHRGQTRQAADIHSRPKDGVASLAYSRPKDGVASLAYDRVLSRRQYAEILGVTLRTLSRYEKAGNAPPRTRLSDRRWGYRQSAVDRFLSANTEGA